MSLQGVQNGTSSPLGVQALRRPSPSFPARQSRLPRGAAASAVPASSWCLPSWSSSPCGVRATRHGSRRKSSPPRPRVTASPKCHSTFRRPRRSMLVSFPKCSVSFTPIDPKSRAYCHWASAFPSSKQPSTFWSDLLHRQCPAANRHTHRGQHKQRQHLPIDGPSQPLFPQPEVRSVHEYMAGSRVIDGTTPRLPFQVLNQRRTQRVWLGNIS